MRSNTAISVALCIAFIAPMASAEWQSTGPDGGPLKALWIDPLNNNRLLAGSQTNGLFESLDQGQRFSALNGTPVAPGDAPFAIGVQQLLSPPGEPNTIVLATGSTGPTGGVFKSIDAGHSWQPINQGLPQGFNSLSSLAFSNDGLILYAAASDGIYASLDRESWTFLENPFELSGPRTVATSPTSADRLYASSFFHELYKTDDGGMTWQQIGNSFENYAFGVDQKPGERLFRSSGLGRIDISDDLGESWTNTASGLTDSDGLARFLSIVPTTESDAVYALSSNGLFLSSDNGGNWTPINRPQQAPTQTGANRFVVGPDNTFYLLTDVGLYVSKDDGASWQERNVGIKAHRFTDLTVSPVDGSWITQPFTAFRSIDDGQSWSDFGIKVEPPTKTRALGLSGSNPARMYAATGDSLMTTEDFGLTWNPLTSPTMSGDGIALSWVDPTDDSIVVVAVVEADFPTQFGGLFRSVDGGFTWAQVFDMPADRLTFIPESVAYDPSAPSTLYFGIHTQTATDPHEGLVLRSTDHGESFDIVLDGISSPTVVVDSGGNVYVAGDVYGARLGVWRSSDGGSSWSQQNSGLPMPFATADLATHPSRTGHVFAANAVDIFESTDGGGRWHALERSPGAGRIVALATATHPSFDYTILAGSAGNIFVGRNVSQNEPYAVPTTSVATLTILVLGLMFMGLRFRLTRQP